ncbi:alanine racemase [Tomitella cavernea]|uniref:Alanine racemase n=1 Tax=Tomitella cavernea TaxID=1387982 RepID=A0ABP9CDT3_9ACTN|nr:alanine racemase [Tomitella cavernea]
MTGQSQPSPAQPRPPRPQALATIDHDALAHNVGVIRECAGDTPVMAVVKADGYGHGAAEVARTMLAEGVRELGVCTLSEALGLRAAGITAPILSWLHAHDADFAPAIAAGVELAVSTRRHLAAVVDGARRAGAPAVLTIKVDTGLNRNGVNVDDWPGLLEAATAAQRAGDVRLRGIFTHFARADEPDHPVIDIQAARLKEMVDQACAAGLEPEVVHAANSAATLTRPDLRFDMVRPGIALYGLSPMPEVSDFGLRPVMRLSGRFVNVKTVREGEGVSYGHTWTAPHDTTVGVLPLGYADGIPRTLSGRFDVAVGGERRPAVGRVCMDQFVVDLGLGSGVEVGDEAVIFGDPRRGEPHAQEWADALGTIHYEVVTGVKGRVQRRYVGGRG